MEARTVTPQQLADMLGVCKKTASRLMRRHPRCYSVGAGTKEYLRLPLEDAEAIVCGEWSPIRAQPPKPRTYPSAVKPAKPKRRSKPLGRLGSDTPYVQYR